MTKYAFLEKSIDREMRKEAVSNDEILAFAESLGITPEQTVALLERGEDPIRYAELHPTKEQAERIISQMGSSFDDLSEKDPAKYEAILNAAIGGAPVDANAPVIKQNTPGFFERNLPFGGQTLDDAVSDAKGYAGTVGRNFEHAADELGVEAGHLRARMGLEHPAVAQRRQNRFDQKWDPSRFHPTGTSIPRTQRTDEVRPLYTRDPRKFWPVSDIRQGGVPIYYTDEYGQQVRVDENGNDVPRYLSYDPSTGEPMDAEYYRDADKNRTVHWPHPVYSSDGKLYDALGNEVRENPAWAKAKPLQQTISGISQAEYDALMRRAADEQGYAESIADNWFGSSVLGKALGMQHTPFENVTYYRNRNPETGERSGDSRDFYPIMRRSEDRSELVPAMWKDENGNDVPLVGNDGKPVLQYQTELRPSTSAYNYYTGADEIENPLLRAIATKTLGAAGLAGETFARANPVTGPAVNLTDAAAEASRGNYAGAGLDVLTAGLASKLKPTASAGKSLLGTYAEQSAKNLKGIADSFRHVPLKRLTSAGNSAFAAPHPVLASVADGAGWLGRGAAYAGKQVVEPALRVGNQLAMMPFTAVAAKYGLPGALTAGTWGGKELLSREGIGNPHAGELDIPSKEMYDRFNADERVPQGWFGKPMYEEPYNSVPKSVTSPK